MATGDRVSRKVVIELTRMEISSLMTALGEIEAGEFVAEFMPGKEGAAYWRMSHKVTKAYSKVINEVAL